MGLDEYLELATKNTKQRLPFMQKLVRSKIIVIGLNEKTGGETEELKLMNALN